MSSSRPKAAPTSDPLSCPECGKAQIESVVETLRLASGLKVEKLRHYKCRSCGSRFYDEAIHRIQAARKSKTQPTGTR